MESGHLQGGAVEPPPGESFPCAWRGPLQSSALSQSWHSEGGVAAYTGSSAEASGGEDWLCLECDMEIQELSEQA